MISVQLVDDHEVVRSGFRYLLNKEPGIHVVAESATGRKACRDYKESHPDIIIMDISLPDISGLEVMRRILLEYPKAKVLMLSMHGGIVVEHAMQMGACGFVSKHSGARTLVTAIRQIKQGQHYIDHDSSLKLPAEAPGHPKPLRTSLTKRELEVCLLLTQGKTVTEIADCLFVSSKTVYNHRENIMAKLGVTTIIELAQIAARIGINSNN